MQQLTRFIVLPALVGALLGLMIMWFLSDSQAGAKPGYAAAVARATPAVVNIQTRTIRVDNPLCRFYRGLCEAFPSRAQQSLGSGVILRSDGYILTNEHVVGGADEILVMFANGQVVTAEVIGSDLHTDLAVIKVAANGLPVIPQAEADDIQVGDIALAIGNRLASATAFPRALSRRWQGPASHASPTMILSRPTRLSAPAIPGVRWWTFAAACWVSTP